MRTTYSNQLANDIMAAYRNVNKTCDCRTQQEAYELTILQPAPRYYVSASKARAYVTPLLRGDSTELAKLQPLRRQMYQSLAETVVRLSQKRQFIGKSSSYILTFAVKEPAPRFFIGTESLRKIHRKQKKHKPYTLHSTL